jgi:SAM-dependent methyltransferase
VERLRCGVCGDAFDPGPDDSFICRSGHSAVFSGGFLDASAEAIDPVSARTFDSFGYEWNTFDIVQPEDEEFWRIYFRDVPLAELSGKIGLDAGCGKGRYTFFTARHLGELVAMDGSSAVQAAVRNLAALGNVTVVRADLRNSPFAAESFDFISCLGVLHHLANPEAGFRKLVDLLVPGGLMLIYVYSRPDSTNLRSVALRGATALRRLTVRLPFAVLKTISIPIAACLYLGFVTPGRLGDRLGVSVLSKLPLATYRGKPLRSLWLDTFDRLSAPVENRYIWPELKEWFERSSTTVVAVREEAGWFVTLRKSSAG